MAAAIDFKAIGTGAIVDFSNRPAGAILEAKLLAEGRLQWVERAQIQKVLAEQNLQAMFSPEGGKNRVALGKILKADLLLLVRTGSSELEGKKREHWDVVACESQRGLRLASRTIPITSDAEKDAAEMESVLTAAMEKLSEKIKNVCVVPPFVNQDLDYRYSYLSAAYARSLEQHLMNRKGVVLVELAEARSLAQEVAVSGETLERPLPIFFVGEFRNTGEGSVRSIAVTLRAQRGAKTLASRSSDKTPPNEVQKTLARFGDEMADKALNAESAGEFDVEAEIEALTERANAFFLLGNHEECLSIAEAAFLLDPDLPHLSRIAAMASANLVGTLAAETLVDSKKVARILSLHRRGVELLESALTPRGPMAKAQQTGGPDIRPRFPIEHMRAMHFVSGLKRRVQSEPSLAELHDEVLRSETEAFFRILFARAKAGTGDEHRFISVLCSYRPKADATTLVQRAIELCRELPSATERTVVFSTINEVRAEKKGFARLVADLSRHSDPKIREAVPRIEKEWAERDAQVAASAPIFDKRNAAHGTIAEGSPLREVKLTYPPGTKTKSAFRPMAIEALGNGADMFGSRAGLFLMNTRGELEPLNGVPFRPNTYVDSISFDGRYAWVCLSELNAQASLYVFDPSTRRFTEVTQKDGLPIVPVETQKKVDHQRQKIMAAPLAPGRSVLVGYFGRTWLATATFDTSKRAKVDVFFEAKDVTPADEKTAWKNANVAFVPACIHVVGGQGADRRVLVGREADPYTIQSHPLVVDPVAKTVEVLQPQINPQSLLVAKASDKSLLYLMPGRGGEVVQFDAPDKISRPGITGLPDLGFLVVRSDEFLVAGVTGWVRGSIGKKTYEKIAECDLPHRPEVWGRTNHYGLLLGYSVEKGFRMLRIADAAELASKK